MQIKTNKNEDHVEEFLNVSKGTNVLCITRRENVIRCNVIQQHPERSSRKSTLIILIIDALHRSIFNIKS